jgi:predicted transcriptional regulator
MRISDDLWDEVLRIARDQHVTATEIVRRALRAYVGRYPADS